MPPRIHLLVRHINKIAWPHLYDHGSQELDCDILQEVDPHALDYAWRQEEDPHVVGVQMRSIG